MHLEVATERGSRRCFASVLDWPGWCRAARSDELALEALQQYAGRYGAVLQAAALAPPPEEVAFEVVEELRGNATTDFGAPAIAATAEAAPLDLTTAELLVARLSACWSALDAAAAAAPATLRKGPRGGGRDRDAIVAHVAQAEVAYARKVGITRLPDLAPRRRALVALLGAPSTGAPLVTGGWTPRYAIRRIAWHALDHAFEIEDRCP